MDTWVHIWYGGLKIFLGFWLDKTYVNSIKTKSPP